MSALDFNNIPMETNTNGFFFPTLLVSHVDYSSVTWTEASSVHHYGNILIDNYFAFKWILIISSHGSCSNVQLFIM